MKTVIYSPSNNPSLKQGAQALIMAGLMSVSSMVFAMNHGEDHSNQPMNHGNHQMHTQGMHSQHEMKDKKASAELTSAVVKRVQMQQGKITLKHEYINAIDMPPMTMTFTIDDAMQLKKFKRGDKVKFSTTEKLHLTHIEKVE